MGNPITGVLILIGIATYSVQAACTAFIGSAVGAFTATYVGGDQGRLCAGLWGFNPALTALAVSIFFVPVGYVYLPLVIGAAIASALLAVPVHEFLGYTIDSPALTLPFCLVTIACFLLGGRTRHLVRARTPHSPEVNLQSYYSGM